jgi:hypothetical protein
MIGIFSPSAELLQLETNGHKYVLCRNGELEHISGDREFALSFYKDWRTLETESGPLLLEKFRAETARARLLGLTQSLDKCLPDTVLRVVIDEMEKLLESGSINEWAINRIFATPLDFEPGFIRPIVVACERSSAKTAKFLKSIYTSRLSIKQFTNRWQGLPAETWSRGPLKASELWCHLIESCMLFKLLCTMRVQEFTVLGDGKLLVERLRVTGHDQFLTVWNAIPFLNDEERTHSLVISEILADHLFVETQTTLIEDSSLKQIETSMERPFVAEQDGSE